MGSAILSRREAILEKQTEMLYNGLKFSCITAMVTAVCSVSFIGNWSQESHAWSWLALIIIIYSARWIDRITYYKYSTQDQIQLWNTRFKIGAYIASVAWASGSWILFPVGQPEYQAALIVIMGGVAGGALATQPYDRNVIIMFQGMICIGIVSRLILDGEQFALELASLTLVLFILLISGARKISKNYHDLLALRQENEEKNLTIIKTSEEMAHIGYWKWDLHSQKLELSDNLAKLWGTSENTISIRRCFDQVHSKDLQMIKNVIHNSFTKAQPKTAIEFRIQHFKTQQYLNMLQVTKRILDSGGIEYLLGTVQDITKIKSAEKKIYKMAYYDELTGLANRGYFHQHLRTITKDQGSSNIKKFALLYIDLDDFKSINDSYGHECGDDYLKQFAQHLTSQLRESDFVARIGGDEFCIILHGLESYDQVSQTTKRCLNFMQQVILTGHHRITPKMSIGISCYPKDGVTPDALVNAADLAMYTVKNSGKQNYTYYTKEMAQDSIDRIKLEADLRAAIINNEFELWYQPKISLSEDRLYAVEALIRWHHPKHGMVQPNIFIETAERIGLINEIGEWVLNTACAQLHEWKVAGLNIHMAINIAGDHLISDGFVDNVCKTLRQYQISKGELEIEITESMSRNPLEHTAVCKELRQVGVSIAIDDFGTGYSSLSVLSQLEVDTLKIDRSFITGLPSNQSSVVMVKTIINLAESLGFNIVAEGIETIEQLELLDSLKCPYIQGYFFSKPVKAIEIPLLSQKTWLPKNHSNFKSISNDNVTSIAIPL